MRSFWLRANRFIEANFDVLVIVGSATVLAVLMIVLAIQGGTKT